MQEKENNKNVTLAIIMVVICLVFIIIYKLLFDYELSQIVPYKGYAVTDTKIAEELTTKHADDFSEKAGLTEVNEQENIYIKLGKYYVGEERKKQIDIDFPIFINENLTLYNLSSDITLITRQFDKIEGYPRFTISGGNLYNSLGLERIDTSKYLFIRNPENIYINLTEMKINTSHFAYEIPINSMIYFGEEFIAYYEIEGNLLKYNKIADIDKMSIVEFDENTYTYEEFLIKLGLQKQEEIAIEEEKPVEEGTIDEKDLVEEEEEPKENEQKQEEPEKEPVKEKPQEEPLKEEPKTEIPTEEEPKIEIPTEEPKTETPAEEEPQPQEEIYIKPEVKIEEFVPAVYSARTRISIKDPARKIVSEITFTVKYKDKVYLRRTVTSSGIMEIVGLAPNSKYTIEAKYVYLNEEGEKVEKRYNFKPIETKGIDTLEPIELSFENGEIFPNKIAIKNLKIASSISAEAVKGIKKIEVKTAQKTYKIGTTGINYLRSGKMIQYETAETLKSNSEIAYEIKIYDLQNNELEVLNALGKTRTAKQVPKATVRPEKQDISEVIFKLNLNNPDNATMIDYKYEVLNTRGDIVARGELSEKQEKIFLYDLDPNQYYTINIYSKYDIEDEKGLTELTRIGTADFSSMPLSLLGYLNISGEITEIQRDNVTLRLKINEEKTDSRLVHILKEMKIQIYDKQTGALQTEQRIVDQIEDLKVGDYIDLNLRGLKRDTEYSIEISGKIKQGNEEQDVKGIHNISDFRTLKEIAKVYIKNQFVTEDMLDFDVKIEDLDGAISGQDVTMEIRTQDGKIVKIETLEKNQEFLRLTYNRLTEKTTYNVRFYAAEYNEGSDATTFKSNYLLKEINAFTEPGISGQIGIESLKREEIGKNLVDVKSETKWYSAVFNTSGYWGKTFDENTEILTLTAGKSGYGQIYTYDLRNYIGEEITVSFKARKGEYSEGVGFYFLNNKTNTSAANTASKPTDGYRQAITTLNNDWQEFKFTTTVRKTGYVGFYLTSPSAAIDLQKVEIKELQIEKGSRKTAYENYQYGIKGNIQVNLLDSRDEIANNDFYLQISKNGEQIALENYQEITEENTVENWIKTYTLDDNTTYEYKLLVKIRDRFYELDEVTFNTSGEIEGIRTLEDFLNIQPMGNYIVLNDIDLSGKADTAIRFGYNFGFKGKIDFQGHKLIRHSKDSKQAVFYRLDKTGVIENLVLDNYLDREMETDWYYGLISTNYGTIKNLVVNLKECNKIPNIGFALIGGTNRGTITNFVINLEVPYYVARNASGGVLENYGEMKNGYIYGQNISADFEIGNGQERYIGGIIRTNQQGGLARNLYSLVNIDMLLQEGVKQNTANAISYNYYGYIENIYSVGLGNTTDLNGGPTVYSVSNAKTYNVYYFGNKTFSNSFNAKSTNLALHDVTFQENVLNSENQFEIKELVERNYYPHVKMSDKMPNQEYIELPGITDEDLADIVSLNILEDNDDTKIAEINVYNPSGERITNIGVENLDVIIKSQSYSDQRSIVNVELKNPRKYLSKYDVRSITTQGAYNIPYTRNYEANERFLNVEFYKNIYTVEDWKNINTSLLENYQLKNDLDFANEIDGSFIIGKTTATTYTFTGKIEGNGHTISNITIPTNKWGIITTLNGEIRNLNIKNYKQITNAVSYVGIIRQANAGTKIDNVHVDGVTLVDQRANGTEYVGGLIGYAVNPMITNCSIKNLKVTMQGKALAAAVGGFVGYGSNITVTNSFVQDFEFNISKILQYSGIGGIVGNDTGSGGEIKYCYTVGKINTDADKVGGIYGVTSSVEVKYNYTLVNIYSQNDNIGGIGGYNNSTWESSTQYNLSLGNIYSEKISDRVRRIVGNKDINKPNFAYAGQLINGFVRSDAEITTLLSGTELFKEETFKELLDFQDAFNYDGLPNQILPKVYKAGSTELVENQVDNKLEVSKVKIDSIEAQKQNSTTALAKIIIDNPSNLNITGIDIENMNVAITDNFSEAGKTYVEIRAEKLKAYDSYRLTGIKYTIGEEEKVEPQEAKISVQFFNEIYTFEDWQGIDQESAQNYKLMADIDFEGKINPNKNVSIGRLEADGEGHILKNLDISLNTATSGLIKEIKYSLKNVTFENITIENTTKSGNYTGLIVRNIGDVDKVTFKDITINAPKMSYVAPIANNASMEMTNITSDNVTVNGISYVAGLCAVTDSGRYSEIVGRNLNITGTGNYTAGILGYIRARDTYAIQNITVTDSNITGNKTSDSGGYTGGVIGYGRATSITVDGVTVKGARMVGGIFGSLYTYSADNKYFNIKNSTITGTNIYIGGIAGYANELRSSFVTNCTVKGEGVGSHYVGGLVGYHSNYIRTSGVIDTEISGDGYGIGGIVGYGQTHIYYCYTRNITVTGDSEVGGIVGRQRAGSIVYNCVNAKITATTGTAGGVTGYLNNQSMTGANYTSRVSNIIVEKTTITAPQKAGGLIGNVYENLYDKKFFTGNLVEADIISEQAKASMGIGGLPNQNVNLENFFISENSTINEEEITSSNDNMQPEQLLTVDELLNKTTYTGKIKLASSYFDVSPVTEGNYPYVRSGTTSLVANQIGIPIRKDGRRMLSANRILLGRNAVSIVDRELPSVTLYAISANEVNIEFSNIKTTSYFKFNDSESIEIKDRAYTFKYDYKTPIVLELSNEYNTETLTIEPSEVANYISTNGDEYYYLTDNVLKSSKETIEGEYVNLYDNKALRADGKVFDLELLDILEGETFGVTLEEKAKPIEQAEYKGNTISTFAKFTKIEKMDTITNEKAENEGTNENTEVTNEKVSENTQDASNNTNEIVRDGQIFIRNGAMSILSNSLSKVPNGQIIDNYNNEEHETILTVNKKLENLKVSIKYPEDFKNEGIKQIVTKNIEGKNIVMCYYETGRVYVFDYIMGEMLYDNGVKKDIGVVDYIKNSFTVDSFTSEISEQTNSAYEQSKDLIKKLQEKSVESAMGELNLHVIEKDENSSHDPNNVPKLSEEDYSTFTYTSQKNYISTYNEETGKYDIFDEDDILDTEKEEIISETTKIAATQELTYYYQEQTGYKINALNGFILVFATVFVIVLILIRLKKREKREQEEKI